MSCKAEGRGLIHKGDKTTTGGVVIQGVGNIVFVGEGVTQIGMIATCPACKKGQGDIVPTQKVSVMVDNIQAALDKDIVNCGCPPGKNRVIASLDAMQFSQVGGQVHGFKPFVNS